MHKPRKKETIEARLLKPSLSGSKADYEETWRRRSSKKLDLDAPLLSVRRNRGVSAERQEPPPASSSNPGKGHRSSSSFGRRPLVPFFTWEQSELTTQAIVPAEKRLYVEKDEQAGLVLRPPPVQQQARRVGRNADSSDARSEFAHTEVASLAPTYVVSHVNGEEAEAEEALVEYNAADRDAILRRFLPAAKEVADEMSSRVCEQQGETWRQMIAHPSPQVHHRRRKVETPQPKKSFGELINMRQDDDSSAEEDEEEVEVEEDEVRKSTSCQVVGDSVCGFFPLLRMIQASSSRGGSSKPKMPVTKSRALRKVKTVRKKVESPRTEGGEEEEFWSDQGGKEELDQPQMYMACRYTPSRGGLKSPMMVAQSKGFLGMPRDRLARITYIKRMYPVFETSKMVNDSSLDTGSVSSESIASIKLDKPSSGNSRQSSSGGMEKVFCLDTLNQVREGGGAATSHFTPRRSNFSGDETFISVVDERGHPNVVVPSNERPVESGEEMLFYSTKKKTKRKEEVVEQSKQVIVASGNKEEQLEEEEEEFEVPAELRICWHGDDNAVVLPTPRGPSHSWLKQQQKKKLAQASRKPPLATKRTDVVKMLMSA